MSPPSSAHASDQTHAQKQATDAEAIRWGSAAAWKAVTRICQQVTLRCQRVTATYASAGDPDGGNPRAPQQRTDAASVGPTLWWDFGHHRRRTGILKPHELDHVAVGDPDPTADGSMTDGYQACRFEWTDETTPNLILNWSCTREPGHHGKHLAGTGQWVVAVHPQLYPTRRRPGTAARAGIRKRTSVRRPYPFIADL